MFFHNYLSKFAPDNYQETRSLQILPHTAWRVVFTSDRLHSQAALLLTQRGEQGLILPSPYSTMLWVVFLHFDESISENCGNILSPAVFSGGCDDNRCLYMKTLIMRYPAFMYLQSLLSHDASSSSGGLPNFSHASEKKSRNC